MPPHDALQNIRSEIMNKARAVGVPVEKHHHEVATAGQAEIDMRYSTLTKMADYLMMLKYVIKNTARKHGKVATFMPKPLFGDNGSGMHTHQSLAKAGTNLFFGKEYASLSQLGKWYIGGRL